MRFPIVILLPASALALASCSANRVSIGMPSHPQAAELTVEPEPALSPGALASESAYEGWNEAVRAWGQRGWDQVARLCRWHRSRGASVTCPEPDAPPTR